MSELHGDRALGRDGVDLLGFSRIADRIARSILDRASADGIVLGLEGRWGSGKTSLLAITLAELEKFDLSKRPAIIEFRPWLVGNRDALLATLFGEIAKAIDQINLNEGDATGTSVAAVKDAANRIRNYGKRLGSLAPLASAAGWIFPGMDKVASVLESLQSAASVENDAPPLVEIKRELDKALSKLPRRVVVAIDDVDRLEPAELAEILRLVRSVADFPNVVYLLCYDQDIVAAGIEKATGAANGHAFLEKIIQVAIPVPRPEPFALRRMFQDGLMSIVGAVDDDVRKRVVTVVDQAGGRWLKTPRIVNRTLDSLRIVWPALRGEIDLADLVWVNLAKLGNRSLHKWIESYSSEMAVIANGLARPSQGEPLNSFRQLEVALEHDSVEFKDTMYELDEHLPGIKLHVEKTEVSPLFGAESDRDRQRAISGRRLASPDHQRLYFALDHNASALRHSDYESLWAATDTSAAAVGALLAAWAVELPDGLSTKLEIALDRLSYLSPPDLTEERAEALLLGLAGVLDLPAKEFGFSRWFGAPAWTGAKKMFASLRACMPTRAKDVTERAFKSGKALAWLTFVFRDEISNHGRFGNDVVPEDERLLSPSELDAITAAMHARYSALSINDLLATPRPVGILSAWLQSGDPSAPRQLIADSTASDGALVDVLLKMGSIVIDSDGEHITLDKKTLGPFFDFEDMVAKVDRIAASDTHLAGSAKLIQARLKRGERFSG